MTNLAPLTAAAKTGVPALESFLRQSVPWLARAKPYLGGLIPVIDYVNTYRREVAAFFANSTASTQATALNPQGTLAVHYVRLSNPINPETLSSYQNRLDSNRGNPYIAPGGYNQLVNGLSVFGGYLCTSNPQPSIGPSVDPTTAAVLSSAYYTSNSGGPPCKAQPPLASLLPSSLRQSQSFPHLQAIP